MKESEIIKNNIGYIEILLINKPKSKF
jgi:hypothetical protein